MDVLAKPLRQKTSIATKSFSSRSEVGFSCHMRTYLSGFSQTTPQLIEQLFGNEVLD